MLSSQCAARFSASEPTLQAQYTASYEPTANRLPYGRFQGAKRPGIPGIESAAGSLNICPEYDLFFNAILQDDIWAIDESVLHIPWRRSTISATSKPLWIGVILESDHQPIHPPILPSLTSAQSALSKADHTLIPHANAGSLIHPSAIIAWKLLFLDPIPMAVQTVQKGREPLITSLTKEISEITRVF